MRGYQGELDEALRQDPKRLSLVRCRTCELPFLTSKSNEGRDDMRCPTGCWDHHDRADSNRRSADYYRTKQGQIKKEALNRRRSLVGGGRAEPKSRPSCTPLLPVILRYYGWLIRVLDGIRLNGPELAELRAGILKKVRQRSRDFHDDMRDKPDN